MDKIVFRELTLSDVKRVHELECICFISPWSYESLQQECFNKVALYVVAEADGVVVGYAGTWMCYGEAHITNIAVAPECRRRGIAKMLVLELMHRARLNNCRQMTLEVRQSNLAAQRLYEQLEFGYAGVRKKYYSDTGENALIMWNNAIGVTLAKHKKSLEEEK